MNRRSLIGRISAFALGFAAFRFTEPINASEKTASPHADAIAFVIKKKQKEIKQIEFEYFKENGVDWWNGEIEDYYWHDTISRSWSATRPMAPGVVDSTHLFIVVYSINDKSVASWTVKTDKKEAKLNKNESYNLIS